MRRAHAQYAKDPRVPENFSKMPTFIAQQDDFPQFTEEALKRSAEVTSLDFDKGISTVFGTLLKDEYKPNTPLGCPLVIAVGEGACTAGEAAALDALLAWLNNHNFYPIVGGWQMKDRKDTTEYKRPPCVKCGVEWEEPPASV